MKRTLTGIKPTGIPQLGNYFGAILPALRLAETTEATYFVADLHALTTDLDGARMRQMSYEVAAVWLALGLDVNRAVFFRQSDVPELTELTWVLSCVAPKGLLNRAHAYKACVQRNEELGRDPDDGVNMGLFNYPVLMAADILMFQTDLVPVGADQKQHVEIARDIAESINRAAGEQLFRVPEPVIDGDVAVVPGTDGRKMSKSYGNTIPIFSGGKELKKTVMGIVTDSAPVEAVKDPEKCNVFNIYKLVASPDETAEMAARYRAGGLGYGDAKKALLAAIEERFSEPRQRYEELLADTDSLEDVFAQGAEKARAQANATITKVRAAFGLGPIKVASTSF